jgi:hypothetical protein
VFQGVICCAEVTEKWSDDNSSSRRSVVRAAEPRCHLVIVGLSVDLIVLIFQENGLILRKTKVQT